MQIANSEATIEYLIQMAGSGVDLAELEKIREENRLLKIKLPELEDKFEELEARLQCRICLG